MDGDSTQKPATPIPCASQCGFFGNPLTDNLCSKCYRDAHPKIEERKTEDSAKEIKPPVETKPEDEPVDPASTKKVQTDTTKCFSCSKKVGLLGFKCRCEYVFCSSHRYSDKHECSFDYKTAGKAALAKANPVVSGSKINKI